MKELLEYLVKNIADKPEEIEVSELQEETGLISLSVITNPLDTGQLIGKRGVTVNAIKELLKIKARQENKWFFLEIKSKDED